MWGVPGRASQEAALDRLTARIPGPQPRLISRGRTFQAFGFSRWRDAGGASAFMAVLERRVNALALHPPLSRQLAPNGIMDTRGGFLLLSAVSVLRKAPVCLTPIERTGAKSVFRANFNFEISAFMFFEYRTSKLSQTEGQLFSFKIDYEIMKKIYLNQQNMLRCFIYIQGRYL